MKNLGNGWEKIMIKTKKMQLDHDNLIDFIINLHTAADFYEHSGFSPKDFIESSPAMQDKMQSYIQKEMYDFDSMSWGAACSFIISHSEEYRETLKSFFNDSAFQQRGCH